MTDPEICKTYSTDTLKGIVRDLSKLGQWRTRLKAAQTELKRRRATR